MPKQFVCKKEPIHKLPVHRHSEIRQSHYVKADKMYN